MAVALWRSVGRARSCAWNGSFCICVSQALIYYRPCPHHWHSREEHVEMLLRGCLVTLRTKKKKKVSGYSFKCLAFSSSRDVPILPSIALEKPSIVLPLVNTMIASGSSTKQQAALPEAGSEAPVVCIEKSSTYFRVESSEDIFLW